MSASGDQSPEAAVLCHTSSELLSANKKAYQSAASTTSSHGEETQESPAAATEPTTQPSLSAATSHQGAQPMPPEDNEQDRPSLAMSGNVEMPSSSSASVSSVQSPGSSELFDASQRLRSSTPPSPVSPPSEDSSKKSDPSGKTNESPEPFLGTIAWPTSVSTFSTVNFPTYVSTTGPSDAYTGPSPAPLPSADQIDSDSAPTQALVYDVDTEVGSNLSRIDSDATLGRSSSTASAPANPLGSTFARDALLKYAHAIYHQISHWDGSSSPPQSVLAGAQMPFFMPMLLNLMRAQIPELGTANDAMDIDEPSGSVSPLTLKRQILFRQRLLPLMLQLRHLHP